MIDNERDLQKKINDEIVKDLHQVDNVLDVINFMSKFQHLSAINWKWVRSQNEKTELLLTENAIKNNGFQINANATRTFIFVPVEVDGKTEFQRHTRYDISQTNAQITDFPNRIRDYTLDENKEILERYLGVPATDFKNYFKNKAEKVFSNHSNLTDEIKNVHTQLTQYVVNKYFGIDTTAEIKPAIDKWLELNQASQQKIKLIDLVHFEAQKIIKEIENELAFPKIMTKKTNAKETAQTPNTQEISHPPTATRKHEPPFSFDKLIKDLDLNKKEKVPTTLADDEYKEIQGVYSFINFLEAVGEQHPTLMKSQSTKTRGIATNGLTYDNLNRATYEIGDLRFEFNSEENVIMLHVNDELSTFDVFDGSLPEAFNDFKEQLLNEIDRLQQIENEKAVETGSSQKQSKGQVTDEEIQRANDVDIVHFIQGNGIDLYPVGRRGRYESKQYSSLVVLSSNNRFYHNATDRKGGTIDFAQKMLGIEHFVDAVNYINNGEYDQATYVEIERGDYTYNQTKESPDFRVAHDYLVNERKIDVGIVKGLHERKGLIRQDIHGNVLFPFIEQGEIVGCSVRQTVPNEQFPKQWTQLWSAEFRGWNFLNGEPENLKFFEDPIDVLSYMSIHKDKLKTELKNTWFISLHGAATKYDVVHHYMREALNYHVKDIVKEALESVDVPYAHAQKVFDEQGLNDETLQEVLQTVGVSAKTGKDILEVAGKKIESMAICTDNDKAGWKLANGFKNAFDNRTTASNFYHTEYKIEIPDSKDWNDERKLQVSLIETKHQMEDSFVEVNNSSDEYIPAHLLNPEQVSRQAHIQTGMEL